MTGYWTAVTVDVEVLSWSGKSEVLDRSSYLGLTLSMHKVLVNLWQQDGLCAVFWGVGRQRNSQLRIVGKRRKAGQLNGLVVLLHRFHDTALATMRRGRPL